MLLSFQLRTTGALLLLALSAQVPAAISLADLPSAPHVDARNYVLVTTPIGHYAQLKLSMDVPKQLPLPLMRGQTVGTLILSDGDKEVSWMPLAVLIPVQKASLVSHWWNVIKTKV
jgi:hypothetical protein